MKKSLQLLVLLVAMFLLTGCAEKIQYNILIDSDSNVKMEVIQAQKNESIDHDLSVKAMDFPEDQEINPEDVVEKTFSDEERWAYVEEELKDESLEAAYSKEKYDDGEYKGFLYAKDLGNIDDVTVATPSITVDNITESTEIFSKDGEIYSLNIPVRSAEELAENSGDTTDEQAMIVELSLTLPAPAETNNATNVSEDKLTYTWDLMKIDNVEASFKLAKGIEITDNEELTNIDTTTNIAPVSSQIIEKRSNTPIIVCAVALVVLLVAVCAIVKAKKK